MSETPKIAVLHVMMNPATGPWNVIRQLSLAQNNSRLYSEVALGLITDSSWPAVYENELRDLSVRVYRRRTFKIFGTAQHLLQLIVRPGIERWAEDLAARTGAGHVIIHFHNAWTSGVFLPLRSKQVSMTSVVTFHGIAGAPALRRQPIRRRLHRWIARRLIKHGGRLTSVDKGSLDAAKELFGMNGERFTIIPNGMPVMANEYGPFVRGADWLTLAHVGSLTEAKGWHIAAEAVISLAKAGCKIRLIIAGTGPQEAEARQMAEQHPDCITFAGRVADPCRNLLPDVDLFVLMTSNDGLPMAIIEAMSCGIPVVSTRIGGIPDAIEEGESGFIIDRTADALARVVGSLHDKPAQLIALSQNTKRLFARKYEINHIVRAYHSLYESCCRSQVK
jgi:glycosyltransferase involved in cell wall biosynthesis